MAWKYTETTFDILGGYNTLDSPSEILQTPRNPAIGTLDPQLPIGMPVAQNVYAPTNRNDLATRPGFTTVRSTAINAAGAFTSLIHMGTIADILLMTESHSGKHSIYQDSANPPAEITSGTNFTVSADNLVSTAIFRNSSAAGVIFVNRSRDLPQFVTVTPTRSNMTISGTGLTSFKPKYVEVFGQRALYADYDQDGTVYIDRVAYTDIRNGQAITDITTQFYSFETRLGDSVRGMHKFSDICVIGKLHNIFSLVLTTQATNPFAVQEEPGGRYKGVVSHQAMVETGQRVYWMGQSNIHSMDSHFLIRDHADRIKNFIRTGLSDSRRTFTVGEYDITNNLIYFALSSANASANDTVLALNTTTDNLYYWTLSRNAFGLRQVSGQNRLIGGGYVGLFYNEATGLVGNLDDATALIDADVQTPRHHLEQPNLRKLFVGVKVVFAPQTTSEAVTVQYRLDDGQSWSDFGESPYSVQGTTVDEKFFRLAKVGTHLQLRFRDATINQAMRISKYIIVWRPLDPKLQ